jgi:hypothetical protein
MDTQDVVRLLTIANNDLPSMEYRYEKLKREEASYKQVIRIPPELFRN